MRKSVLPALLCALALLSACGKEEPLNWTPTPATPQPTATAPAEGEAQREELSAPTESEDKPRLLYYNPQGKVGVARSITLTFSHSMMALGGQFNAEPARLEPPVAGEWVWRDVRTAVFHPQAGRLPMATPFEIILDPSLTDGRGRPLELGSEPLTLETEGLRVSTFAPYGRRSGLNPLGYIIFNQPVDPALVISKLRLQVQGEAITAYLQTWPSLVASRFGGDGGTFTPGARGGERL